MPESPPRALQEPQRAEPFIPVDALAHETSRPPSLNPFIRMGCYLAGRREAARLEWAIERDEPSTTIASHWLERNQRTFLQQAQEERNELERRAAPAGRELRMVLRRIATDVLEVDRLRRRMHELDAVHPVRLEDVVRAPGEVHLKGSIVLARRERKLEAERVAAREAFDAARLRLARLEERKAELVAVIRLSVRRTLAEIERLRAHFGRRAEVAARGVGHRSVPAAAALGLLHGVSVLPLPEWVTSLEGDLLPRPEELRTPGPMEVLA